MQKKEFTSFDVAAVIRELRNRILAARLTNVYQINGKTLLLKLHKPESPNFLLVLEAGRRLHLSSYEFEKPSAPPAFCMALRKYLRNAILIDVKQHEFERVVFFSFKTKSGNLRLVMEVFGEGNAVLVGESGEILHALTYKRMKDRNILRGEKFALPPSSGKNPLNLSVEEFREGLESYGNMEVARALARFLSIGGFYAEEVLIRAGVDKTHPCFSLDETAVKRIFDSLQSMLKQTLSGKLEPCVVIAVNEEFLDVVPLKLKRYNGLNAKLFESFNEALDEFYIRFKVLEKTSASALELQALKREAERLRRIIKSQEQVLVEAQAEAERCKQIGDTIYAYSSEIQKLIERILTDLKTAKTWRELASKISGEKAAGIKPSIFFEGYDSKKLLVNLCIENLRFSLNLRSRLFNSANKFYEQSKKAKKRFEGAETALRETQRKLAVLEEKIMKFEAECFLPTKTSAAFEEEIARRRIKRKEWFEKFKWFKSSDGFLVVAGKDAVSNEILIKKHTASDDIVFHADVVGAPFVVVKTDGKQPSLQCLKEAAEFAAAHSRGWREGFAAVDIYWIKPEQIGKAGASGEHVPRGAFVISGKRNWMRNVPLKTAVGIIVNQKSGELDCVGGPTDAIKARTNIYLVIVPGNIRGEKMYEYILNKLMGKAPKEIRGKIRGISFEEIKNFIPYARGQILREQRPNFSRQI